MRSWNLLALASFVLTVAIGSPATAEDKKAAKPAKCPVSGKPTDGSVFVEINGEKTSVCCGGCIKRYEKKLGVVDHGPKQCAIASKKSAKAETRLLHAKATAVGLCCKRCLKKWATEHKIVAKADKGAEGQKCALSGKPAKAEHFLTINGEKKYFCCPRCVKGYATKKLGLKPADLEKATKCVISSKPAERELMQIHVKYEAKYFCCDRCRTTYAKKNFPKKAPAKKGAKKTTKA